MIADNQDGCGDPPTLEYDTSRDGRRGARRRHQSLQQLQNQ